MIEGEDAPSFDQLLNQPVSYRQARISGPLQLLGAIVSEMIPPPLYADIKKDTSYSVQLPIGRLFYPGPMIPDNTWERVKEFYEYPRQKGSFGAWYINRYQKIQIIRFHSLFTDTHSRIQSFNFPGDYFVNCEQKGGFYNKPIMKFGNQRMKVEGVLVRSIKELAGKIGFADSPEYDRLVLSFMAELQANARVQDRVPTKIISNYFVTCYPPYLNGGVGANLLIVGANRVA